MVWRLRFYRGVFGLVFRLAGSRIEVAICNRADELDRTARSPTSTTPQSTSVHGDGGWNGRGMAWRLRFYKWILDDFLAGA